jgi:uncharacterized tellurite resistance protein B-like protein
MARRSLIEALGALLDGGKREPPDSDVLGEAVRAHVPDASVEEQLLIAAVAGLLASVAFADAVYTAEEREKVREELGRIHGLGDAGVDAICAILERDIAAVTAAGDQRWIRDLKALTDHDQRLEVLEVLIDLAAADDDFSMTEQNYLRRLATALGLSPADYVAAQARHREKLSLLRSDG